MQQQASDLDFLKELGASGAERMEMVTALAARYAAKHVLEVGVWKGEFAQHILDNSPDIETYYMLDPWRTLNDWNKPFNVEQTAFDAVFDEAMAKTEAHATRRKVLRGTTTEVVGSLEDGSIDLAYIDGDHTLRGVLVDMVAVWPKIRAGGVVICDDFSPSIWQHNMEFEPSMVFPAVVHFAEGVGSKIVAIGQNQSVIFKAESDDYSFEFIDLTGKYKALDIKSQLTKLKDLSMADLLKKMGAKIKRRLVGS